MPMFDDPKKELQRLQKELLAEEEYEEEYFDEEDWLDQEIAEAKALSGYQEPVQPKVRNFANGYGAREEYPEYQRPVQPQQRTYLSGYSTYQESRPDYQTHRDYRDQVMEEEYEEEKGLGGLVALACLLTMGIVGVALYWVLVLL